MWLSVPFGIIITLICFSGAMLVFENEVNELMWPELYFVKQVEAAPLPVDQLLEKVAATLPDDVSVSGVSISSDPERTYQVSLSKPRRSSVYVDQYTGEITGKNQRSVFFAFMFRMHRWLLDSMNPGGEGIFWGKMIVGVSTLMFVVVLISGIIVWWPRTRKALKNSLKISGTKGWKRFWYDLHVAGGMYALVLLLAMSLTGLTWSFTWYRTAFYKVFGVEVQQQGGHGHGQKESTSKGDARLALQDGKPKAETEGRENAEERGSGRRGRPDRPHREKQEGLSADYSQSERQEGNLHEGGRHWKHQQTEQPKPVVSAFAYWQEIYDKLSLQNPAYKQISVSSGTASVAFDRLGNQRAADRYSFNTENGEFTETSLYQHQDKAGKIRGWIYSVHVGNWGGMTTRILTFLAALVGASLPLTGYYLWIKKMINKRKREKTIALSAAGKRDIA